LLRILPQTCLRQAGLNCFLLTFFLDKKSKQKNQGKPDASGRFARPSPRYLYAFNNTGSQAIPYFSPVLLATSSMIISVAVSLLRSYKIEKYRGRSRVNKKLEWVPSN